MASDFQRQIDEGVPSQAICFVVRTDKHLKPIERTLGQRGVETQKVSRNSADNASVPGVRLANMHRIKGLEFKALFLAGIKDGVVPLEHALSQTDDSVEQRARGTNELALLHVAGTRAVPYLYVTYSRERSRLI